MDDLFFLRSCKCATLYYSNKDFYANNAYIEVYRISFDFEFNTLDKYTINYRSKKSNRNCCISFSPEQNLHPETIGWDIIKNVYMCPMSIKKFLEKNKDNMEKLIEQAKKDFQPHCKKFYGY